MQMLRIAKLKFFVTALIIPALSLTGCQTSKPNQTSQTQTVRVAPLTLITNAKGQKYYDLQPLRAGEVVVWSGATDSEGFCDGDGVETHYTERGAVYYVWEGAYKNGYAEGSSVATYFDTFEAQELVYSRGQMVSTSDRRALSQDHKEEVVQVATGAAPFPRPKSNSPRDGELLVAGVLVVGIAAMLWGGAKLLGKGREFLAEGARLSIEEGDRATSANAYKCPRCGGYGKVDPTNSSQNFAERMMQGFVTCPRCDGTGWLRNGQPYKP